MTREASPGRADSRSRNDRLRAYLPNTGQSVTAETANVFLMYFGFTHGDCQELLEVQALTASTIIRPETNQPVIRFSDLAARLSIEIFPYRFWQ
jgi:hypothetical protein